MALNLIMRSQALTFRPASRCFRFLSSSSAPETRIDHSDARAQFTEAALAETRQEQWRRYRRSRTWRRIGKATVFCLAFVPVYFMLNPLKEAYLEAAVDRDLRRHPTIRKLLEDAATKPLRGAFAEINMEKRVPSTLSDDTLKGPRLLGSKRAFWNHSQQELLYFQWFGVLLNGWPTVVHGGAIAVAFSDAMSRAAACMEPTSEPFPEPSSLSVTYLKPTRVRDFYVIRVKPLDTSAAQAAGPSLPPFDSALDREGHEIAPGKDLTKQPLPSKPPPSDDEQLQLEATLETGAGKVLVKARASFPKRRPG